MEIIEQLFDFVLRVLCCSRLFGGDATEGNEGGYVDRAGVVKNSTDDLLESTNAREGEDGEVIMGNGCLCIITKMARRCRMWTVLRSRWEWVFESGEKFRNVIRYADVHMSVSIVPLEFDIAVETSCPIFLEVVV